MSFALSKKDGTEREIATTSRVQSERNRREAVLMNPVYPSKSSKRLPPFLHSSPSSLPPPPPPPMTLPSSSSSLTPLAFSPFILTHSSYSLMFCGRSNTPVAGFNVLKFFLDTVRILRNYSQTAVSRVGEW